MEFPDVEFFFHYKNQFFILILSIKKEETTDESKVSTKVCQEK